jgi:RHS repeat-associated protein
VLAPVSGGALTYVTGDHPGSATVAVPGTSTWPIKRWGYGPWGAERFTDGQVQGRAHFTGQRKDETGLHFYNARLYNSSLGLFVSADSIVPGAGALAVGGRSPGQDDAGQGPQNPQDLNRYSYVTNNPANLTDPTGHAPHNKHICQNSAALPLAEVSPLCHGGGGSGAPVGRGRPTGSGANGARVTREGVTYEAKAEQAKTNIGAAREIRAADGIGRDRIDERGYGVRVADRHHGSEIDIILKDNTPIQVGGHSKSFEMDRFRQQLRVTRSWADDTNTKGYFYYEAGTPKHVLDLAEEILGPGSTRVIGSGLP